MQRKTIIALALASLLTFPCAVSAANGGFQGPRQDMLFSDVMEAVISGKADIGVIIHEGRFTYGEHGLVKLLDLGQWWESVYKAPLPLGAIVVRRDVPAATASAVQEAIRHSLDYANANPAASRDYIRACAQELSDEVTQAHIKTFVTEFSRDLGPDGRSAIERIVSRAAEKLGKPLPADGLFLN